MSLDVITIKRDRFRAKKLDRAKKLLAYWQQLENK